MPNDSEILNNLIDRVGGDGMRKLGWQRVRVYTAEEQAEINTIKYQFPSFKDPSMFGIKKLLERK